MRKPTIEQYAKSHPQQMARLIRKAVLLLVSTLFTGNRIATPAQQAGRKELMKAMSRFSR